MLVRDLGDGYQIVLQPDHGDVCGQLAAAWRYDGELDARLVEALAVAAERHDDGWAAWERRPRIDAEGRPESFLTAPLEPLLSSYRASVDLLEDEDPLAALLVSRHVSGLRRGRYGVMQGQPAVGLDELDGPVREFVAGEEERQRRMAAELGVGELPGAYRLLQLLDVLSLHLGLADLTGQERVIDPPLRVLPSPDPWSARCEPWPFREPRVHLRMRRRVLPGRRWSDAAAFRAAFAAAAPEEVEIVLAP